MACRHHRFISNTIQLRPHVAGRTRVLVSTLAATTNRHYTTIYNSFKLLVDSARVTEMVTSHGKAESSVQSIAESGQY